MQFSQSFRRYIRAFHIAGGILLVIVGLLLITDYMTMLNIYALRFTPDWLLKKL
jgi:small neutral amino acid transporter SnatA (MarC family)